MTMPEFSILPEWISYDTGPVEVRQTLAHLKIVANGCLITRIEDASVKTVLSHARLSAYPLALWFASSWWRLRWEPAPEGQQTVDWRMAHDVAAAGHGFVWPRLRFVPDGETVEITSRPTGANPAEPITYLSNCQSWLPAGAFEKTIEEFIGSVLGRLDDGGVHDTELHALWQEVLAERDDPDVAAYRKLEAMLGFDPGEAPEGLVDDFQSLAAEAGESAMAEIAPACAGHDPQATLAQVTSLARTTGLDGRIDIPVALRTAGRGAVRRDLAPWDIGRALAHSAREAWGLMAGPVSDEALADMLAVSKADLIDDRGTPKRQPLGLAVRLSDQERMRFVFRKKIRTGRRFEAARFVADHVHAPATDTWLPETDAKTARQKVQRAFAAEFLCPIDELADFLEGDYSEDTLTDAAEHFGVSPLMVRSHLVNHDLLPSESLGA